MLVADDDHDMVLSLTVLLRDEGHEVLGVHHGGDVVETVGDFAPDALLLDIGLPQQSGYEIVRALRERYGSARPIIVAITGRGGPADRAARRDGRLRLPLHQALRAEGTTRHAVFACCADRYDARVRIAVAVLTFFLSSTAHALNCCSNFGQGRIGAGIDVIHEKGMAVANVSLYPASLYVWRTELRRGARLPDRQPARASTPRFGGILVRNLDENVGTNANFFTRLSWCWTKACLSFAHISHGAGIFKIRDNEANKGLNFLFLEYKLQVGPPLR